MEMKERTSVDKHIKNMKELMDRLAAIKAPIAKEDQVVTLLEVYFLANPPLWQAWKLGIPSVWGMFSSHWFMRSKDCMGIANKMGVWTQDEH